MAIADTTENDLIKAIAYGDAVPAWNASLYISLHSANPGETGDQDTSEATYTSYDRVAVLRDMTGWTVTANQAVTVDPVIFPQCTGGGPEDLTHFAVGTDATGPGQIIFYGPLPTPKTIDTDDIPEFASVTMYFD